MFRTFFILPLWFCCGFVVGQSVVIDIEYQPNTTYQWTKTTTSDRWTELIGDDGYIQSMQQHGYDALSEYVGTSELAVIMQTGDRKGEDIPFESRILTKQDSITKQTGISNRNRRTKLETDDLVYYGKVNRYHKIEIDSIIGTDSLSEKNNAFVLLDEVHRSLSYPKDTFDIGSESVVESMYRRTSNVSDEWLLVTRYRLVNVQDGLAYFDIIMDVKPPELSAERQLKEDNYKISLEGSGELIYDINQKMVVEHSYHRKADQYTGSDFLSWDTKSSFSYSWKIKVVE